MKFACPHCMTLHQVADDRVGGGSVQVRCRTCGELIRIGEGDGLGEAAASLPPGAVALASSAPPPSRGPPRLPRSSPPIPRAPRVPSIGQGHEQRAAGERAPGPGAAGRGALADAFRKEAEGRVAPSLAALATPAEGWFVGMGEVVVGPMTLADLRSRAERGAVVPASLVWRDGFEDWRPLGTYPELLAMVEGLRSEPGDSGWRPAPDARSSVPAPGEVGSLLGAAPLWGGGSVSEIPGVPRSPARGVLLAAAIVVSLLLGLGTGFVVFGRRPATAATEQRASVVPASAASVAGAAVALGDEGGARAPSDSVDPSPAPSGSLAPVPGHVRATRRGLESLSGPPLPTSLTSVVGATDPPPAVGGPLDAGQVQRTVSRQAGAVRRSCWQPALDRSQVGAPSAARVVLTIDVLPSGNVSRVATTPDPPGYPGLSACIAGRVRSWKFPPSGGATVQVPFVFAAQ